jgi:hypothetical protein
VDQVEQILVVEAVELQVVRPELVALVVRDL